MCLSCFFAFRILARTGLDASPSAFPMDALLAFPLAMGCVFGLQCLAAAFAGEFLEARSATPLALLVAAGFLIAQIVSQASMKSGIFRLIGALTGVALSMGIYETVFPAPATRDLLREHEQHQSQSKPGPVQD